MNKRKMLQKALEEGRKITHSGWDNEDGLGSYIYLSSKGVLLDDHDSHIVSTHMNPWSGAFTPDEWRAIERDDDPALPREPEHKDEEEELKLCLECENCTNIPNEYYCNKVFRNLINGTYDFNMPCYRARANVNYCGEGKYFKPKG